jgi:hypothetical protein
MGIAHLAFFRSVALAVGNFVFYALVFGIFSVARCGPAETRVDATSGRRDGQQVPVGEPASVCPKDGGRMVTPQGGGRRRGVGWWR